MKAHFPVGLNPPDAQFARAGRKEFERDIVAGALNWKKRVEQDSSTIRIEIINPHLA